ncbi:DNA repair protein RecO [Candidatus Curtissbacteria bacterium]|nr:DNA repair protein RecO [Candidatus Curtissbacteria bacterium]
MYLRTEGVVLRRKNFGEADRIITLYTRDHGKISALARGVRRPRSKKAGHIELGSWCKVFVARGKNLDLLTEVESKKAFGIKEFTETKANRIYHILELVDSLTPEHQKNLPVFILLVQFLKKCATEEDFPLLSSVFKVKLMTSLGFFSAKGIKTSSTQRFLESLEFDDYEKIKSKFRLSAKANLKLLAFLDSMIENLTQQKLKTVRFL